MTPNEVLRSTDVVVQAVKQALDRMDDERRKEVRDYANRLLGLHTNTVEKRLPYKDGYLQNEYRFTKKGTPQGPYFYFYWFEDGHQERVYIGKAASIEEAKRRVDEKRNH
jgi:hypothetical protein